MISPPILSQILLDTVQHKQVGPGMFYSKYVVHSIPWSIDVLEADMTNQYFAIETTKAFELLAGGREKTSSMAIRSNYTGHWSVGAINGDFFDLATGMPNNIQVQNGEVLRNERADWPTVGFNLNKEVSISKPYVTGSLKLRDSSLSMNGINVVRDNNKLIFYNQFFGASTGTTTSGFEAIVTPIVSWLVNDTVYCIVDSISPYGNNTIIPDGKMVVSANGATANFLSSHIAVSDTVKILLNILPSVSKLKEMIGGYPILVKDGDAASMNSNEPFVYNKHPRTAVGVNRDTTKLFLVTVDGRQISSLGMNLYELADLMLQIGVYQGINLDGGGSTTMVVRNEIMNSPSDASGERPVSNALLVVSKAPLDTLTSLDTTPEFSKVFSFKLFKNYPNPFNPTTKIKYTLPNNLETRHGVSLRVYDILGREVATLVNEEKPAGSYEVEFDGSNLSSGVYFHQLKVYPAEGGASDFINTRKMILLR
jgi:exopolysaccharide biosynthesis protein